VIPDAVNIGSGGETPVVTRQAIIGAHMGKIEQNKEKGNPVTKLIISQIVNDMSQEDDLEVLRQMCFNAENTTDRLIFPTPLSGGATYYKILNNLKKHGEF
jgi:hypothetical protein